MNILRKRISLVLAIVMVSLSVLPLVIVNASTREVNLSYNSVTVENKKAVSVTPGSSVTISATGDDLEELFFSWDYYGEGNQKWMTVGNTSSYDLTVPSTYKNGSKHQLYVSARYANKVFADTKVYMVIIRDANIHQVSMDATLDGKDISFGNTYSVKGGEKLKFTASTIGAGAKIDYIGYYYTDNKKVTDVNSDTLEIVVPTATAGTTKTLYVEAVADNDDGTSQNLTKTGWKKIVLNYEDTTTVVSKDVDVAYNGKTLTAGSTTEANPNESLKITATPEDRVSNLYFKWDSNNWSKVTGSSSYATRIPSEFVAGSTHKLYVKAEYDDGEIISEKVYTFKIADTASEITMNVKIDSKTVYAGKSYNVAGKETVTVTASATDTDIDYITYRFGSEAVTKVTGKKATFKVPTKNEGTKINMYVQAVGEDGTRTGEKVYTLVFVYDNNGELDVEPWMEENDELVDLSVSLRNDSEEEDKANKNIYALEEIVTYYVDYKNGTGDDITSAHKMVLELPLDFKVVNSDGGEVDEDERTITWEFPEGFEEDEAGTKIVRIKYTSLTKSKYTSETIYPTVGMYKGKKEKDRSTVINLIITDYDEKIKTTHEPYMQGDAGKDTFRPDDGISRAEGALVLARIYGLDYMNTKVTDIFSDLDDTYVEAQKAIIAATKAGLINGYTNGTFKPNAKMTKAEFIKILACMVEMNANEEEIEGLEIKDVENLIKVYSDSTRYYIVDGKKVYTHWALEEVSLLARLNMLPLSEDEDEIDLDEEITRAEVAQLVNFYLLRAPASVDSKTKSGFSDVSKKHDLFADIIEATRDEHQFSMNEDDGTEVEE